MTTYDKKAAAEARAAALRDHDRMIVGALQDERRGYVQRGQDDRVALVDEQIEFYRGRLGEDVATVDAVPVDGETPADAVPAEVVDGTITQKADDTREATRATKRG